MGRRACLILRKTGLTEVVITFKELTLGGEIITTPEQIQAVIQYSQPDCQDEILIGNRPNLVDRETSKRVKGDLEFFIEWKRKNDVRL